MSQALLMRGALGCPMSLKDRMNRALAESGKTPAELARACGVKPPSVHGWLHGGSKAMRADTAVKAAGFLGVNVRWLTHGAGPMRLDATTAPIEWPFETIDAAEFALLDPKRLGIIEGEVRRMLRELAPPRETKKSRAA